VSILPYTGENDEWHEMTLAAVSKKQSNSSDDDDDNDDDGADDNNNNSNNERAEEGGDSLEAAIAANNNNRAAFRATDYDSESEMSFEDRRKRQKRHGGGEGGFEEGIDEGTTEQRYIRVGKEHQVFVPPFVPNQKSVSRHPTMVWKPGMITQQEIDDYLEQATKILTPFLRDFGLTQEEPYCPFPTSRLEELSQSMSWNRLPTLSSVSTVSSLSTKKIDALREVDSDLLLRNLHASNYIVKTAIAAVAASPRDFVTMWSLQEKDVFNAGFRRYAGSLRAIYKGMGNKDLQDVIDYHYRFKIPDQFRRFQERKREQAVRMLECIETRRSVNAPILIPSSLRTQNLGEEQKESGHW
jgi:hypothetical protein